MSDMTLCQSNTCPLREECRRNASCSDAYRSDQWQWYSEFGPEGEECYGFLKRSAVDRRAQGAS